MAFKNEWLFDVLPLLRRLPDGVYFDNGPRSGCLQLQAETLKDLRAITAVFPGAIWTKEWNKHTNWWEYHTIYDGVKIQVYAVREGPPTCTAIFETRVVEKKIPVTFAVETVEEQILVGWDCGEMKDGEPADLGLVAVPTGTPVVEYGGVDNDG